MPQAISYSLYTLVPKAPLNARATKEPRRGAILNIDGGFADLHPWPEFGDSPLEMQLSLLTSGQKTPLTERALYFASIDRFFRERGVNALSEGVMPQCHVLVTDISKLHPTIERYGGATYKVKIGRNKPLEIDILNAIEYSNVILRLDANESFTRDTFYDFWNLLHPEIQMLIEFVEDPYPADEKWDLNPRIPLALDLAHGSDSYSYRIIKPAAQEHRSIAEKEGLRHRKIVVTSSLDHPLGQMAAAWSALDIKKICPDYLALCGFLSHIAYETNEFSEQITVEDFRLLPPPGTGFGFDDLLQGLEWKKLK